MLTATNLHPSCRAKKQLKNPYFCWIWTRVHEVSCLGLFHLCHRHRHRQCLCFLGFISRPWSSFLLNTLAPLIHNWNQIWLMSTAATNRRRDSNLGRPGLKLESHPCALSCSHPPSVESVSKSQSIRTKFAAPFQPIKFLQQPSKQNNYFNFFLAIVTIKVF